MRNEHRVRSQAKSRRVWNAVWADRKTRREQAAAAAGAQRAAPQHAVTFRTLRIEAARRKG